MNIENKLFKNLGELQQDESGLYFVHLCDAELDAFRVEFHYDDTAKIITEDYSHIHLSQENLSTIQDLIFETNELYKLDI